jgi:uncharacterized repeat protein (TIGR01451 family)
MEYSPLTRRRLPLLVLFASIFISILILAGSAQSHVEGQGAPGSAGPDITFLPSVLTPRIETVINGPYVHAPIEPLIYGGSLGDITAGSLDLVEQIGRGGSSGPNSGAGNVAQAAGQWKDIDLVSMLDEGMISEPILNIDGIATGSNPHDPVGDVGPDHYIQMVNSAFAIFDKQGAILAGPANINSIWISAGATGNCATNNSGDPIVLYDPLADRWIMSQFTGRSNTDECIAVSRTADPVSGGWYLYEFDLGRFGDYPKLAVWPDAYYLSANFDSASPPVAAAFAFDRANMLNGNPASSLNFTVSQLPGLGGNVILPSDLDGAEAPPFGSPNTFYRQVDTNPFGGPFDRVELFQFSVDWGDPDSSTFTGPTDVQLAPFESDLCGFFSFACIPQPGTTTLLDPINEWPMWRLQYRNFGSHEVLVGSFTVDADGSDNAGIRWFELRKSDGGVWSLYQQGTYAPEYPGATSFEHRWNGSIAMDRAGNIALGYSVSNSTDVFPSIRYAGRMATDPLGVLPHGEVALVDGQAAIGSSRWGDYSSLNVDPADGCTFWYTNDYVNNAGGRQTRIGTFQFPSCLSTDLAISKTAHPDPVNAGGILMYDIVVSNNGGNPATNVVVTDTLPLDVAYDVDTDNCVLSSGTGPLGEDQLICSLGDVAGGANSSFTIQVTVDQGVLAGGGGATTITNMAEVDADQEDPNLDDNMDSATTIVHEEADLRVSKDCKPDRPLTAGEEAICTITVENLGLSLARNVMALDAHLSDGTFEFGTVTTTAGTCTTTPNPQVGSGTVSCELGDVAAGDQVIIRIPETASGPYDINDRVTVTSDTPDPDMSNNEASDTVVVTASADLAISKTAYPDPVIAGELLTYTLVITNYGPSTAYNVIVEDNLPAEVSIDSISTTKGSCQAGVPGNADLPTTCALGNMAAGDTEMIIIVVLVSPTSNGLIQNDAQVYSDSDDPDNSNNFASTSTMVEGFTDLEVVKTSRPNPVIAGMPLFYDITVTNQGGRLATNVVLTDTLPLSVTYDVDTDSCVFSGGSGPIGEDQLFCSLGDLAGGEHVEFTIQVTVDPDYVGGSGGSGTLTNHVTVSSDQDEPNTGNNTTTSTTIVAELADLRVNKDCKPDQPINAGEEAVCTIIVENLGPSTSRNVVAVDIHLSDGVFNFGAIATSSGSCSSTPNPQNGFGVVTCELGNVAAGDSVIITIRETADGPFDLNDQVTVTSDTLDLNLANNQASDTVVVTAVADLSITKGDSPDPVNAGDQLTYTLEIHNDGPSLAYGTIVEDVLPAGVLVDSVTASIGSCQAGVPGNADLPTVCALGNLEDGDTETVVIVVTVLPQTVGLLQNDALVYSDSDDPDNTNNFATATTTVSASADLAVMKNDSPDPVFAGERLVYEVIIDNYGPSTARDVSLTDNLPVEVTYIMSTVSNGTGTCVLLEIPPNTVSCDLNDLNPGEFVRVIIETLVDINVPDGTVLTNVANVSSAAYDPDETNNTATATTTVLTQADLEILMDADVDIPNPSWTVKYTLEVINHGASDAQDVVVVDDLPLTPKKVVYVFDTGNGACNYDEGSHQVTCNFGTLDAGESISVEIYVKIRGSVGLISNVATVSSSTYDHDQSNNVARKDNYIHG